MLCLLYAVASIGALRAAAKALYMRVVLLRACFPEQRQAILHPARQKGIKTPRRSGKTTAVIYDFFIDALSHPNSDYAYIALTQDSAEHIVWDEIDRINKLHQLGWIPLRSKLRWEHANGCKIYVLGANTKDWMETFRGVGRYRRVVIDECKSYRIDLHSFIKEVVRATLVDRLGSLWVIGTPGDVPQGFWWDVTRDDDHAERDPGYVVFEWDVFANIHIARQVAVEFAELKSQYGEDVVLEAWFRREWMGQWAVRLQSLVYDFSRVRNVVQLEDIEEHFTPDDPIRLSLDFGHSDGYAETIERGLKELGKVVVLEAWKRGLHSKLEQWQGEPVMLDEVAERCKAYLARYRNLRIVADNANAQLLTNLQVTYGIPVYDATKTKKQEHQQAINTEFRKANILVVEGWEQTIVEGEPCRWADGRVLCLPSNFLDPPEVRHGLNPLVRELTVLRKHYPKTGGEAWVEHPSQSNDCADTMVYGIRSLGIFAFLPDAPPLDPVEEWGQDATQKVSKIKAQRAKVGKRKHRRLPW